MWWSSLWAEWRVISSLSNMRSAEFLLATIKLGLAGQIFLSTDRANYHGPLNAYIALGIGVAFLVVALLQLAGVLKNWVRFRQAASLMATFMWLYFVGLVWATSGTPMGVLVYIPLLCFNIMLFTRLSRLRHSGSRGGNE